MTDKMSELIDFVKTSVKEIYAEHGGEKDFVLSRVVIGIKKNNDPFFGPFDWGNSAQREHALKTMRLNLALQQVTHYVVVSECWVAVLRPDETIDNHVRPADREDRREVVNLSACSIDGVKKMITADIIRDENGVATIGEFAEFSEGTVDGDLFNMFETMPDLPPEAFAAFDSFMEHLEKEVEREQNETIFTAMPDGAIMVPNTSRYAN